MTRNIFRKHLFHLPPDVVYLDGNSLGPLPVAALQRLGDVARAEWGDMLIGGWNDAGWMQQPAQLGDRIGRLIGAAPGSVMVGETLSIRVYQALDAALRLRPGRKTILSDTGNFPSDLYIAQGLIRQLDRGHRLRLEPPERIIEAIDDTTAVVLLTDVDYRTARRHDMRAITEAAHRAGALMVWDLAHSAGAVPIDLAGIGADFAAGCTYKYLNAGPGAPAFVYAAPSLVDRIEPALAGWLGHAAPFDFDPAYHPAPGIGRLRVGTPPVLQMAALEAALDVFDGLSMVDIQTRAIQLSDRLIAGMAAACPTLELASPRQGMARGSHVAFRFDQGYAVMQALIAAGVIGDFRAPDILRFGIAPLYLDEADIDMAVAHCARIIDGRLWDDPAFTARKPVT